MGSPTLDHVAKVLGEGGVPQGHQVSVADIGEGWLDQRRAEFARRADSQIYCQVWVVAQDEARVVLRKPVPQ